MDPAPDPSSSAAAACAGLEAETIGPIPARALVEASGLAASRRHEGVVWVHNDSGTTPLIAVGPDGAELGTSSVPGLDGFDIEDMALIDGVIYLADIGDNDERRAGVQVYRFDEPTPGEDVTGPVERIELRYPDRARDAEAFLVDPLTGDLVIVEKSFRFGGTGLLSPTAAAVFAASPPFDGGPVELRQIGTVALDALAELAVSAPQADALAAQLGLGGVATGADIRADGAVIALRTYATVWLFSRGRGESIGDALASAPCEAPSRPEEQGEAITFLADGSNGFVTVSEGSNPDLNVTRSGS